MGMSVSPYNLQGGRVIPLFFTKQDGGRRRGEGLRERYSCDSCHNCHTLVVKMGSVDDDRFPASCCFRDEKA